MREKRENKKQQALLEKERRQREKLEKKEQRRAKRKANWETYVVRYVFVGMFVCLAVYFAYFVSFGSSEVIKNPLNNRVQNMANIVVRGEIRDRNGTTIAHTETGEDGKEVRVYDYGSVFAHPVGYMSKGLTGIESLANLDLLSSHVGFIERLVNEVMERKNLGDNVYTTMDAGLQEFCYQALGGQKGAIVVNNPKTGEILAMVSTPGYDPNNLDAEWDSLTSEDNQDGNLLNRVTQGQYPPGSTFKILTALEYMREYPDTYEDFTYECDGVMEYGDLVLACHEGHAHGTVDFKGALAQSCNGAFATMGLALDKEKWAQMCEDFGFNQELPLDLLYNESSFVVDSDSTDWDVMQSAIGQGETMESPMHNLMITSAVANDGTMMVPYIIDHTENADGEVLSKTSPTEYRTPMTAEEAAILKEDMISVVAEGSGYRAASEYAQVAGKTGSAQYNSTGGMHAWFTGFAPAEDPEIALTVIIEGGGSGGEVAAPIAGSIFNYYFGR